MKCVCFPCELLLHTNNPSCEQSHLPLLQGEELGPGGDGQPSVAIKSMWDSVVSWMKMADCSRFYWSEISKFLIVWN